MKIKKSQHINLYVLPQEIVPEDCTVNKSTVSIPQGLLPVVITRATSDLPKALAQLSAWFQKNLKEVDGYIPASAALPALWLDRDLYDNAVAALIKAIKDYKTVQGPVFVGTGLGRDARFCVADFMQHLLHGSTLTPVVTFKQAILESSTTVPELSTMDQHVQYSNHIFSLDPAAKEDVR